MFKTLLIALAILNPGDNMYTNKTVVEPIYTNLTVCDSINEIWMYDRKDVNEDPNSYRYGIWFGCEDGWHGNCYNSIAAGLVRTARVIEKKNKN